mmetsp:Transcript_13643/g.25819  ORF Transcript_13643/g.25819 Transcript_13643/m.25819 type:complete len:543 (-) Transcript_13643:16-1644(-)
MDEALEAADEAGEDELDVEALEAAALEALTAGDGEEDLMQEDDDLAGDEEAGEDDEGEDDLEALEAAALASFAEMSPETSSAKPVVTKPAIAKQLPSAGKGSPGKGLAAGKGSTPGSAKGKPAAPWAADRRQAGKPGKGKLGAAQPADAKGKGQQPTSERSIGRQVVDLNKAGIWAPGKGIDTKALQALRQLPERRATEILSDIEGLGASVRNPSSYIQAAVSRALRAPAAEAGSKTPTAPWRSASDGKGGVKRTAAGATSAGPPSKRLAIDTAGRKAAVPDEEAAEEDPEEEKLMSKLPTSMLQKVRGLRKRLELKAPALKALANCDQKDGLIVLQALGMRDKVEDPTRFIVVSLRKKEEMRQGKAGAGVKTKPIAKSESRAGLPTIDRGTPKPPQRPPPTQEIAKAAGKPVVSKAKPSVGKTPPAKPGAAKPAVAKPAIAKAAKPGVPAAGAKPSGSGKPPRMRDGLDFEQMMVQGKLQTLNKLDIWSGPHPLDDAALTTLLSILPARASEILDEAEERGAELKNPSLFVQQAAKKDHRA